MILIAFLKKKTWLKYFHITLGDFLLFFWWEGWQNKNPTETKSALALMCILLNGEQNKKKSVIKTEGKQAKSAHTTLFCIFFFVMIILMTY